MNAETPKLSPMATPLAMPPEIHFGRNVSIPSFKDEHGKTASTILTEEEYGKAIKGFEHLWNLAETDAPKLQGNMEKYSADLGSYNDNFMAGIRAVMFEKYQKNVAYQGKERADEIYISDAQKALEKYVTGLNQGRYNEGFGESMMSAGMQLFEGDWMGAIKTVLYNFPETASMIAAGKRVASQVVSGKADIKNIGSLFQQTLKEVKMENAYGGAAEALGLGDHKSSGHQYLVNEAVHRFSKPEFSPIQPTSTAKPEANLAALTPTGLAPSAQPDTQFSAPNGTTPASVPTTPAASQPQAPAVEAVATR